MKKLLVVLILLIVVLSGNAISAAQQPVFPKDYYPYPTHGENNFNFHAPQPSAKPKIESCSQMKKRLGEKFPYFSVKACKKARKKG